MKQHPLCTDTEHDHDVMNLAVPPVLKREWAALQTRRHFLGRTGKVLGWAAIASLLGKVQFQLATVEAGLSTPDAFFRPA